MNSTPHKKESNRRKKMDFIDPNLPEDVQELQRKAIEYRRQKNYYQDNERGVGEHRKVK